MRVYIVVFYIESRVEKSGEGFGRVYKSYLGLSFLCCSFFFNVLEKLGYYYKELRNGFMFKLGRSGVI